MDGQRVALLQRGGIGPRQQLELLIHGVGGAEDGAKLVGSGVEIAQLAEFGAPIAGVLRIAQEELLKLGRCQDAGQFLPRLLAQSGQFPRVEVLAIAPLRFQVSLHALLRAQQTDLLDRLLGIHGQLA